MKQGKRIHREKIIQDLKNIDSRLKFINYSWNLRIKSAFNSTGSFNITDMAYSDINLAEELVNEFKLIR
tara:strand:+ start:179 stop:385 length:207 start_codon:yes stop_codon:yes gene_type:complete